MKKLLTAVLLSALLGVSAVAQHTDSDAPATRDDVQRYLDAIHSHQMMSQMVGAMAAPMHKMIHDQFLKDKDKLPAGFEEQMTKMMDDMFRNMPLDEMMQAMVPVYQKHLTKGDIDALIAFYSSPVGQKMLREMPAIMGEAMESVTPLMEKYMESVKQQINDQFAQALRQSEKKSD